MSMQFSDFGLNNVLLEAITAQGYLSPTDVQERVIPMGMQGLDLMVSSQTGSGKTAAFLLPILHQLLSHTANEEEQQLDPDAKFRRSRRKKPAPQALILCPTRELAQQVAKDAIALKGKQRGMRIALITGGMPYHQQIKALDNVNLLVATPGRLLDLYDQGALSLSSIRFFVCDEADRMLDLGFSEDLESISRECSNIEQTLMFSATFPKKVTELASYMMKSPQQILLSPKHSTNSHIEQNVNWVDDFAHQDKLLLHWLDQPTLVQCIVFTVTQIQAEQVSEMLADLDYKVTCLHGGMTQKVRNNRLDALRKQNINILVATDVVARGIDIATITHVINYGLPMKPEDYVHRIGRTGRAGRTGVAVTLVGHNDRRKLQAIEQYLDTKLLQSEIPGLEPKTKMSSRPAGRLGGRNFDRAGKGKYQAQNGAKKYPAKTNTSRTRSERGSSSSTRRSSNHA